jgi:hypothetical protein
MAYIKDHPLQMGLGVNGDVVVSATPIQNLGPGATTPVVTPPLSTTHKILPWVAAGGIAAWFLLLRHEKRRR